MSLLGHTAAGSGLDVAQASARSPEFPTQAKDGLEWATSPALCRAVDSMRRRPDAKLFDAFAEELRARSPHL